MEVLTELAYGRQCDALEYFLKLRDLLKIWSKYFGVATQVEKERRTLPAAFDTHNLKRHPSKEVPDRGANPYSVTMGKLHVERMTDIAELVEKCCFGEGTLTTVAVGV